MKVYFAFMVFTVVGGATTLAESSLQSNQMLVASIVQSIGVKAINDFPDPSPILGLLETNPNFKKLCEASETTWNKSILNLATNNLDRASRLVILHSYLYLSPGEYIKCLDRVLDIFQQGKIGKDEVVFVFLIPPRDENCWILSYNADKSQVVKVLDRLRLVFDQDKDIIHLLDIITNGDARRRDERLRNEKVNISKRKVPLL